MFAVSASAALLSDTMATEATVRYAIPRSILMRGTAGFFIGYTSSYSACWKGYNIHLKNFYFGVAYKIFQIGMIWQ